MPLLITALLSLETPELWNTQGLVVSYKYVVTMMYSVVQISSYSPSYYSPSYSSHKSPCLCLQVILLAPLPILQDSLKLPLSILNSSEYHLSPLNSEI
jgi:hypothetical protein